MTTYNLITNNPEVLVTIRNSGGAIVFTLSEGINSIPNSVFPVNPWDSSGFLSCEATGKDTFISASLGNTNLIIDPTAKYANLSPLGSQYKGIDVDLILELTGEQPATISPFNKLYWVDNKKLVEISQYRTEISGEAEASIQSFVINILKLPFKIPDSFIGNEANILFGDSQAPIMATEILVDDIEIDLGAIEIPDNWNNSITYQTTKVVLVIPFVDIEIDLPVNLVIGKTISIIMNIDAYNGNISINVFNGGEFPIESKKSSIGRIVPFKPGIDFNSENIGSANGIDNKTFVPYVKIENSEFENSPYDALIGAYEQIGNILGYVEVDSIELTGNMLSTEREQIISSLRNGVIIK